MKRLLVFWILLTQIVVAAPSFDELVEAVANHDEQLAIKLSDQLISKGDLSEGLYYNRGLSYLNLGEFARARASFEQVLLFAPRDIDTRRKLQQCLTKLDKKLSLVDVSPTPWLRTSEAEFLLFLPVLFALGLGLRKILKFEIPSWQPWTAIVFAVVITGGLFLTNPPPIRGVVIDRDAEFRSSPEAQSGPNLLPGQLVEILEKQDHLYQVRTGEGKTGWTRAAKVVRLRTASSDNP